MPFSLRILGGTRNSKKIFFAKSKIRLVRVTQVLQCGKSGASNRINSVPEFVCWDWASCKKSGVWADGPTTLDAFNFAEWEALEVGGSCGRFLIEVHRP